MLFGQPESETYVSSNPINISQPNGHQRKLSVSISMPSSSTGASSACTNNILNVEEDGKGFKDSSPGEALSKAKPKGVKFLSQPMPKGSVFGEAANITHTNRHPNIKKLKEKRFNSFKTCSGKLERQLTNLRRRRLGSESEDDTARNTKHEALPVDRYFDALEGPELETLRASEEIVLPDGQTWPFLLSCLSRVLPSHRSEILLWSLDISSILSSWSATFGCIDRASSSMWMSGGQWRLSKVANPTNHLSVVGNFVGALLAPSVASMAWATIRGSFDYGSWIAYFIALFLYFSLVLTGLVGVYVPDDWCSDSYYEILSADTNVVTKTSCPALCCCYTDRNSSARNDYVARLCPT
ncbi:SLAC1, putative isoform 2 [Hibiscus syriacus]|uniref:SLAC1, putative isoform 2 n=1 Tax=Hibiscus syriacus TaxID=106335 RepID=A0A6A2XA15_HIBSY|nr:SLAC1, putative isoform 2 [Hibiscus syriacus]